MAHPVMFEDTDPYLARLRTICLPLPEAQEKVSHGRPTFFTKKIFAGYGAVIRGDHDPEPYARSLVFLPDAADRPALLADARFFEPAYLGPYGWLGLDLARAGSVARVPWDARRCVLPPHCTGPPGAAARRRRPLVSRAAGVAAAPPWHSQNGHVVRLEWGPTGAEALTRYAVASGAAVTAVVVDVLSVGRGRRRHGRPPLSLEGRLGGGARRVARGDPGRATVADSSRCQCRCQCRCISRGQRDRGT